MGVIWDHFATIWSPSGMFLQRAFFLGRWPFWGLPLCMVVTMARAFVLPLNVSDVFPGGTFNLFDTDLRGQGVIKV